MRASIFISLVLGVWLSASCLFGDDVYVRATLDQLTRVEGNFPVATEPGEMPNWALVGEMRPYAALDGPGEVFLTGGEPNGPTGMYRQRGLPNAVCVHTGQAGDIMGRLFVAKPDASGMVMVRFRISPTLAEPGDRREFFKAKQEYYDRLAESGVPGSAWFRHEAREAGKELGQNMPMEANDWRQWRRPPATLDDTYSLFTGGRAVGENLQLDRLLLAGGPRGRAEETVEVKSIEGITVQPMDWSPLTKNLAPKTDPLASLIPADQHGIFFPNLSALAGLIDEAEQDGSIVLPEIESRIEDSKTRERYERQLGVSMAELARAIGPDLAASVAVTGSDAYLRSGSDLTVLFEAKNAAALKTLLLSEIAASSASNAQAKASEGNVGPIAWSGWASPDGVTRSYVAEIGGAVALTNSLEQLERLAAVHDGRQESLAKRPEYTFFRDRYRLGEGGESALIVLSDATSRRWCGARWRIADSRRTRAAAVLSELQATWLDALARQSVKPGPIYTDLTLPELGDFSLTSEGVVSSAYGSLNMMTPIAQFPMDRVTPAEADAYKRWRDTYEQNWRWFFDPIAVRLSIQEKKLSADVTVMPLIWGSDYRALVEITRGVKLAPDAGDPHDSLWHVIIALNKDAAMVKQGTNYASNLAPGLSVDPLGWLGQSVGLYVDDDPVWDEMAKAQHPNEFLENNFARLPIALRADVSSGLKLAAFLVATRGFIEQTSPGMTVWENLTYKGRPYVRITPSEQAKGQQKELEKIALYYVASGDSFLLTLNEALMKRALDREMARTEAEQGGKAPAADAWLGESIALRGKARLWDLMLQGSREQNLVQMQLRAWSNLPALNEWRRRYPDQDPVKLHERVWGTQLLDPGGGQYVWNEQWQTMESTDYGCPAEPKNGPTMGSMLRGLVGGSFGITFEDQGLRGRVEIERAASAGH